MNRKGSYNVKVLTKNWTKNNYAAYMGVGNSTESTYTYNRQRERLQDMQPTANGNSIMNDS